MRPTTISGAWVCISPKYTFTMLLIRYQNRPFVGWDQRRLRSRPKFSLSAWSELCGLAAKTLHHILGTESSRIGCKVNKFVFVGWWCPNSQWTWSRRKSNASWKNRRRTTLTCKENLQIVSHYREARCFGFGFIDRRSDIFESLRGAGPTVVPSLGGALQTGGASKRHLLAWWSSVCAAAVSWN